MNVLTLKVEDCYNRKFTLHQSQNFYFSLDSKSLSAIACWVLVFDLRMNLWRQYAKWDCTRWEEKKCFDFSDWCLFIITLWYRLRHYLKSLTFCLLYKELSIWLIIFLYLSLNFLKAIKMLRIVYYEEWMERVELTLESFLFLWI